MKNLADTDPAFDDRPTDPMPPPTTLRTFPAFGELTDAELREIIASQQTPLPLSHRETAPTSQRTFIVYERIVDTRHLRRGATPARSTFVDLLAFTAFVSLFTGICVAALR